MVEREVRRQWRTNFKSLCERACVFTPQTIHTICFTRSHRILEFANCLRWDLDLRLSFFAIHRDFLTFLLFSRPLRLRRSSLPPTPPTGVFIFLSSLNAHPSSPTCARPNTSPLLSTRLAHTLQLISCIRIGNILQNQRKGTPTSSCSSCLGVAFISRPRPMSLESRPQ